MDAEAASFVLVFLVEESAFTRTMRRWFLAFAGPTGRVV
jgi:hypothetical protein